MTAQQAYERGKHDAKRDRAPIFRDTRMGIVPTVDDDMSDDWSHDDRFHYLQGYQEG
jgi:hypothetical protein